jgi:protein-S-isoprenylcysteine O-methyltransferase Ste14
MSEARIFKSLFISLFVLVLAIRAYFGLKQRSQGQSSWSVSQEAVAREGRWSLILRPIAFLLMLSSAVLYLVEPPFISNLYLPIPSFFRYCGAFLGGVSLLFLIWVHRTLGLHWSTTLQFKQEHTLVASGPYKFVRHPMYTSLSLFFLGVSVVSSFLPFIALVVVMVLFFQRIVNREEAMMINEFGETYREYMKVTGRYFPRL